ncbi:hypothetical protein [Streptomyces sp. NPDC048269]|uniref:hypothetical protein n=1 Tax=Streptomyces sp. NPDC048269 TaxID=3155753 RepID=UPI00342AA6E9
MLIPVLPAVLAERASAGKGAGAPRAGAAPAGAAPGAAPGSARWAAFDRGELLGRITGGKK